MSWEQLMVYLGYIAVVVAAIKGIQFLFSITPTGRLKEQVEKNTDNLDKDFKHLERVDIHLTEIDKKLLELEERYQHEIKEVNGSLEMIGHSLTVMLTYMAEGDGVDKMKEQRDKLMEYFIKR